jgi:sortase B
MFGEIPEFLEQEFFEEHTTGTLFLPECTRRIQWFACMEKDAYDAKLFHPTNYEDEESRNELLDYIREESEQYRDIGVTASDQIIALSTCESATTDGRILLIGRLSAGVSNENESENESESESAKEG